MANIVQTIPTALQAVTKTAYLHVTAGQTVQQPCVLRTIHCVIDLAVHFMFLIFLLNLLRRLPDSLFLVPVGRMSAEGASTVLHISQSHSAEVVGDL